MSTFLSGGLDGDALIGKTDDIRARAALIERAKAWRWAGTTSVAVLEVLVGFASLALFLLRPREKEYLWFGLSMIFYACPGLLDTHMQFHPFSLQLHDVIVQIAAAASEITLIAFYFCLLRGRRNWLFWLAAFSPSIFILFLFADFHLVGNLLSAAAWNAIGTLQFAPISIWILSLLIRRAVEGLPDARLLLGPVLLQQLAGIVDNLSIVMLQAGLIRQRPDWIERTLQWPLTISILAIADAVFILAILGVLIYRFTRTRQHEEKLSNELEAARAVQQVLIPAEIPPVPGFTIESIYMPASQVGGDFFQIIPLSEGGMLVIIGDVSGKGMPAAMTVSLLVGTVRTLAHFTQSPAAILSAMNQRMLARSAGGFTTCLVLRAGSDGSLTLANAGHIAPYLNGAELPLENGLPLGLAADALYAESNFSLTEGKQLTLMTDGIVEARGNNGELFGFERTRELAAESAELIAQSAKGFGQEDDITVLTIARLTVGEKSITQVTTPTLSPSAA